MEYMQKPIQSKSSRNPDELFLLVFFDKFQRSKQTKSNDITGLLSVKVLFVNFLAVIV